MRREAALDPGSSSEDGEKWKDTGCPVSNIHSVGQPEAPLKGRLI